MNFNLISPSGNGNDYTINFRDPITIGKNSKIITNWIELKRNADIVLERTATIDIVSTQCLPTHIPATPATENSIALRIVIPADTYEFVSFQKFLEDRINEEIGANIRLTPRYKAADLENNNSGFGSKLLDNNGVLGICLNTTRLTASVGNYSVDHAHDDEQTTSGGEAVAYTTTNNNGVFDNYALTEDKFDFYRANCPKDQSEQNGFCLLQSIKNIDQQTGKLMFGLYGTEYAEGIGGSPPTRTNGNNPPVLVNNIPTAFISVILGSQNDHFEIYLATNNTGETIDQWTDQNQQIVSMAQIERLPVANTFNPSAPYNLLFGMEVSNTTDTPSLRWKIANYQNGNYEEIYDSEPQRRNLPFKLLVGDTTTYDNANALKSQIPFVFMTSVTNADEGFKKIEYTKLEDGTDDEPITIIRDYQVDVSDNLVEALGMKNDGIYENLYPNGCQDACNVIQLNLDINWRSKNYSVFINLPTNNYKNVEEKRDGGFKKSILANVPVPFTTGFNQSQGGTSAGVVTSTYIPYNPIVSYLQNNEIQTNNLSIKIVDMMNEIPADEITRSIINFTIEPSN